MRIAWHRLSGDPSAQWHPGSGASRVLYNTLFALTIGRGCFLPLEVGNTTAFDYILLTAAFQKATDCLQRQWLWTTIFRSTFGEGRFIPAKFAASVPVPCLRPNGIASSQRFSFRNLCDWSGITCPLTRV